MTTVDAPTECPDCRSTLATVGKAAPWCPRCEWNLDRYESTRREPEFGWQWVDRATHRLAYRLTAGQFRSLAGRHVDKPGWNPARAGLLAAAVLIMAAAAAMFVFGVYLIAYDFPNFTMVPGAILVLIAVAVRPRLGRTDPAYREIERSTAPTLFALVDQVRGAVGAPVPDVIVVGADFNASANTVGLRRRRVLALGLPLWGVLPPQQRVALLGHELGHFVNGDVRRVPLVAVAINALGTVSGMLSKPPSPVRPGLLGYIAELITRAVLGALRSVTESLHLLFLWLAMRDSQRSEYLADELGARAGGSEAAAALFDTFTTAESMIMVTRREARQGGGPASWRAAADQARGDAAPTLTLRRQLSVRDHTSLFDSHPPSGLRARMIESRPVQTAATVLTEVDSARIDQELAKAYDTTRRELATS